MVRGAVIITASLALSFYYDFYERGTAMADTNYNQVQGKLENGDADKPSKVIKGTAKVERLNPVQKMVGFLFSDKLDSIGKYLTYEVLGPSLRNLAYQLGLGALQMAFFGNNRPPMGGALPPSQQSSGARRDYVAYSTQAYAAPPAPVVQQNPYRQRIMPDDISFDTMDDAKLVLDRMSSQLQKFGKVFLRDFYEFSGITGQADNWTLGSYGWYNLNGTQIVQRIDGRWMIQFPDPTLMR